MSLEEEEEEENRAEDVIENCSTIKIVGIRQARVFVSNKIGSIPEPVRTSQFHSV